MCSLLLPETIRGEPCEFDRAVAESANGRTWQFLDKLQFLDPVTIFCG